MDDIFKSKDDMAREEKINNLFKSVNSIDSLKEEKDFPIVPEPEKIIAEKSEKKNPKIWVNISMILLFLGLAAATGYFFWQYKKVAQNSEVVPIVDEVAVIVEKIKNLADLPKEKPVLATVVNQEQVTEQSFFPQALSDDKILIYIQAKKIILYRPSSNQIVETISLISDKSAETKETNSTETSEKIATKVKVDVLNGTEIKGLAKITADKLSGVENVELAKIGNAQKSTYTKILVVDFSGKNATAAKIIAQKLGGEVGALPEGETKGIADILVIAGK